MVPLCMSHVNPKMWCDFLALGQCKAHTFRYLSYSNEGKVQLLKSSGSFLPE